MAPCDTIAGSCGFVNSMVPTSDSLFIATYNDGFGINGTDTRCTIYRYWRCDGLSTRLALPGCTGTIALAVGGAHVYWLDTAGVHAAAL